MNKTIFKSIGAVFGGFVTVFILSVFTDTVLETTHIFPPQNQPHAYMWWMLLLALIYRTIYTVIGGYVTAALAPNKPMKHVVILAIIGCVAATLGLITNVEKGSLWYPILLVLFAFPSVYLGGVLKKNNHVSKY